jgi:two-component system nitrogen regulation sensor histidine kinase NtrY
LATFAILTGLTPSPTREITLLFLVSTLPGSGDGDHCRRLLFMVESAAGAGPSAAGDIFSLVAVVPAIVVAAFATVTLNRGLDTWFSERTRAIVDSAVTVAEAYLRDHSEATRGDVANISADLVLQKALFDSDRAAFVRRVARHAALRGLAAVFVFDQGAKRIDTKVTANDKIEFRAPPADAIARAAKGELVLIPPGQGGNVVRALIKLQNFPDHYLYVYRVINASVLDQLAKTRDAKAEYDKLMQQRLGVQLTFAMMYAVVAFVFLLAAVWSGLWFSDRLVAPIVRLLDAARRVSRGDLDTKVETIDGPDDLATLSRTFNLMTGHIKDQRDELVAANEKIDARRRFTEAVLAGMSAGVIGIDPQGALQPLGPQPARRRRSQSGWQGGG